MGRNVPGHPAACRQSDQLLGWSTTSISQCYSYLENFSPFNGVSFHIHPREVNWKCLLYHVTQAHLTQERTMLENHFHHGGPLQDQQNIVSDGVLALKLQPCSIFFLLLYFALPTSLPVPQGNNVVC